MSDPGVGSGRRRDGRAIGNPFGISEGVAGLFAGFLAPVVAVGAYAAVAHVPAHTTTYGTDVVSLLVLWTGLVSAVVAATRLHAPAREGTGSDGDTPTIAGRLAAATRGSGTGSVVRDFGLRLRPWPDIPLGLVAGVGAQLLLVPLLEAPLTPFVHHLSQRLGHPTTQLLGNTSGVGLAVLSILVCAGSPLVEELFFRGLVLRALLGRLEHIGRRLAPSLSIVLSGLVFALVHFEALQFIGLAGFGMALGYLAFRTGRLGAPIVAHVAFNSTTVIWYVVHH